VSEVPALELRGFGVSFGDRLILAEVDLTVPHVGAMSLMGPTAAGKSTLLRTLVGLNDAQPALRTWGQVRIEGEPALHARRRRQDDPGFHEKRRIALVQQKARFYVESVRENLVSALPDRGELTRAEQEQRVSALLADNDLSDLEASFSEKAAALSLGEQRNVAIVRAIASDPALLLIDEPTASLDEAQAQRTMDLIRRQATRRAVLMVTHNRRRARELGGTVVLLAGGRVLEQGPADRFFESPRTEAGKVFARTGSCAVPMPGTRPEEIADGVEPPPALPPAATEAPAASVGPRGFHWLRRGRIGGLPRPGIAAELDYDLDGLSDLGITVLVTLEEQRTVPAERLAERGIRAEWLPIVDMEPPTLEEAIAHCARVARWVRAGEVVAVHCKAGLGRTGTLLAAQLVYEGASSVEAIEEARRINRRWIQSQAQLDFLVELAAALAAERAPRG